MVYRVPVVSVDLLLHPVRLRILQAFLGNRALTTAELATELDDVPPGSLYRHVARLVDAEILTIASERRIRGTVERTYRLAVTAAVVDRDELAAMTPQQHRQAFLAFVAGLLGDFDRYLARGDVDLPRDGVSYRITALWLDDAELAELRGKVDELFRPYLGYAPAGTRKRRLLGTVLLPAEDQLRDERRTP
jgi:DNA-binding transcriptional ArsR family regulator